MLDWTFDEKLLFLLLLLLLLAAKTLAAAAAVLCPGLSRPGIYQRGVLCLEASSLPPPSVYIRPVVKFHSFHIDRSFEPHVAMAASSVVPV